MGRKRTYKILLSDEDKKVLHATINNKKTYKMTVRRCQILLELDENVPGHLTQIQIAKLLASASQPCQTLFPFIIYEKPYNPSLPVSCMDEKPYQCLGETCEPLPMRPRDT